MPELIPSSVQVGFVVDEAAVAQLLSKYFGFPLSISSHQSSTFTYMLLLLKAQTGEACESSK
jgi:hypothetical protein